MQSAPPKTTNGNRTTSTIPSPTDPVEQNSPTGRTLAVKAFDPELRERFVAWRAASTLNNSEIGRELGFADGTAVSRYLNGKPEGDVIKFERAVADFLKGISRRVDTRTKLFETTVTRRLDSVTESLQRMGGVGLLYGSAGVGKTCACQLHGMQHPSAVVLTVNQWDRSPNRIETLLFEALDTSSYSRGAVRARWMIERLRGSRRAVIVDNAHRMTLASRRWLFDFQQQSGCPLVLVGEPAIYDLVREDRELASFVRVRRELAFDGKDAAAGARAAAAAVLGGDPPPALVELATKVLAGPGHVRALVHQVSLMRDIQSDPKFAGNEAQAFLVANTQMMVPTANLALPAPTQYGEGN